MVYVPQLDDDGKRILRVIRERGVVAGWQVMSEASVDASQLSQTANKLVGMNLISASGNISNPKEIGDAYFNIQPSNAPFADLVLSA